MKHFAAALVVLLLAALAVSATARAAAPIRAIASTAFVVAMVEETNPPTYPEQGFTDRPGLFIAVIDALRALIVGQSTSEWCPPMQAIADNLDRYFDPNLNPNPARDAFTRDWRRAMRNANCLTTP